MQSVILHNRSRLLNYFRIILGYRKKLCMKLHTNTSLLDRSRISLPVFITFLYVFHQKRIIEMIPTHLHPINRKHIYSRHLFAIRLVFDRVIPDGTNFLSLLHILN